MLNPSKTRAGISKIATVILVIVILVLGGSGAYYYYTTTQAKPTITNVNYIFDYIPTGQLVPFYVAQDQGFFTQNNLAVTLRSNPQGSVGAIKSVAAGTSDIGDADFGALIDEIQVDNITNVVAFGAYFQHTANAVIYLNTEGITKPTDLNGRTLAESPGGAINLLWPAFAANTGIDVNSIKLQSMSASAEPDALLSGSVSGYLAFTRAVVQLNTLCNCSNGAAFPFKDYGLDTIGLVFITNTAFLNAHANVLKEFINAMGQAVNYSFQNPSAAVDSFMKYNSQYNRAVASAEWNYMSPYVIDPQTLKTYSNPASFAYLNPTTVQNSINIVVKAYNLQPVSPSSIYTDSYVPAP